MKRLSVGVGLCFAAIAAAKDPHGSNGQEVRAPQVSRDAPGKTPQASSAMDAYLDVLIQSLGCFDHAKRVTAAGAGLAVFGQNMWSGTQVKAEIMRRLAAQGIDTTSNGGRKLAAHLVELSEFYTHKILQQLDVRDPANYQAAALAVSQGNASKAASYSSGRVRTPCPANSKGGASPCGLPIDYRGRATSLARNMEKRLAAIQTQAASFASLKCAQDSPPPDSPAHSESTPQAAATEAIPKAEFVAPPADHGTGEADPTSTASTAPPDSPALPVAGSVQASPSPTSRPEFMSLEWSLRCFSLTGQAQCLVNNVKGFAIDGIGGDLHMAATAGKVAVAGLKETVRAGLSSSIGGQFLLAALGKQSTQQKLQALADAHKEDIIQGYNVLIRLRDDEAYRNEVGAKMGALVWETMAGPLKNAQGQLPKMSCQEIQDVVCRVTGQLAWDVGVPILLAVTGVGSELGAAKAGLAVAKVAKRSESVAMALAKIAEETPKILKLGKSEQAAGRATAAAAEATEGAAQGAATRGAARVPRTRTELKHDISKDLTPDIEDLERRRDPRVSYFPEQAVVAGSQRLSLREAARLLGYPRANVAELRKMRPELMKKYHPDVAAKNGLSAAEANEAAQLVNEALDTLIRATEHYDTKGFWP